MATATAKRLRSVVQVNLNGVGDPRSDAASEEVAVLGPNGKIERERGRHDGPIVGISGLNASERVVLAFCVRCLPDEPDTLFNIIEKLESNGLVEVVLTANLGNSSLHIVPANLGSNEYCLSSKPPDDSPYSTSQRCADENVRFQTRPIVT